MGFTQQVVMPARIPPKMSEVRLSPMIIARLGLKSGIREKQFSKKMGSGLEAPISSEMKQPSK